MGIADAASQVVRIRVLFIGALLLASACTADQPREVRRLPSESTPAPAETPAPGARTDLGWLAVNLRYETLYPEGAVSFVTVYDSGGERVGIARSKEARVYFRRQVAAGAYEVRVFRRPCGYAGCQIPGARLDKCSFRAKMLADGSNRLVVVRVSWGGRCSITDQGDSIDIN